MTIYNARLLVEHFLYTNLNNMETKLKKFKHFLEIELSDGFNLIEETNTYRKVLNKFNEIFKGHESSN